jgi:hypothetical protein
MMSSNRQARMMLCWALDGADPVVSEMVRNLGDEGAWARSPKVGWGSRLRTYGVVCLRAGGA